jgi:glyoxylase-like metal-dependent hydrolase (beta-lactamase superfamily II)
VSAAAIPLLPHSVLVLERGWLSSNCVLLFDDDEQATLVDSGYSSHAEQTVALVRQALGAHRLARIVNTHLHSDHCGGNARLQREFNARIVIPPGHAEAVARWDEQVLTFAATGQRCDRFAADALLAPGDVLHAGKLDWQILAAPGHDPQSIALWNADQRILISADALWANGFGVIFPELEGESGFAEQRALLEVFAALAPRVVIPGHGAPFTDVEAALMRAQKRLEALVASPQRNARHAAKVLIKFLLLDWRAVELDALTAHLAGARYFPLLNERYWPGVSFADFIARTVDDLVTAKAAELRGRTLVNVDN